MGTIKDNQVEIEDEIIDILQHADLLDVSELRLRVGFRFPELPVENFNAALNDLIVSDEVRQSGTLYTATYEN